jgi:heterotetrameric sarcosine oxidase gamma subunit
VPDLIAKSPLDGHAPLTFGGVTLAEVGVGPITSVAVHRDGAKTVAKALKPLGLTFPAPNSFAEAKDARIVWTGRDQAFLIGVAAPNLPGAAVTDQSDGWAVLGLRGVGAVDTLARLVPLDLRLPAFPVGKAARTQVNHMNAILLRTGDYDFEIMVFRSMAATAWHEVAAAMQVLAARSGR